MPEFYAEHVPSSLPGGELGEFCTGYFECAEWLLPTDTGESDSIDRSKIRGWSAAARKAMVADCRDFYRSNRALLAQYTEATGRDLASAGHDFFLTRERHGAGFWDRGAAPCLRQLTDAAHSAGEAGYPYLHRGWLCL